MLATRRIAAMYWATETGQRRSRLRTDIIKGNISDFYDPGSCRNRDLDTDATLVLWFLRLL